VTPWVYQIEEAKKGLKILKLNMIVYLAWEERTGKSLTAILICEKLNITRILIVTKKKAIEGWLETLKQYDHNKIYTVINYHSLNKLKGMFYDLVILDEAHNYISGFPEQSKLWHIVASFTKRKPLIYLSATPFAQGYQLLYHQFKLSNWSPWSNWKTSKHWFNEFGIPKNIFIKQRAIPVYTDVKNECFDYVKHLFMTKTRKELNFKQEPKDKLHWLELNQNTKDVYNTLVITKAINLNGWDLICDSVGKLRTSLHMLEGGVALVLTPVRGRKAPKRNHIMLGNTEKIDWIKKHFGDTKDTVIMYNYVAERLKLMQHFKNAIILQATSFAEGTDLSPYDHLIIYSQDFSTAKHVQRRARQANKLREKAIIVHFLLIKKAISNEVYKAVSINKQNYVDSLYEGTLL